MTTLPATEIERITHRVRPSAQCRMLRKLGIDFRESAIGEPLVSAAVYEAWLGGDTVTSKDRPKLNMEAFNAA